MMALSLRVFLFVAACMASFGSGAAESDVHFGLTKFLALQAGYEMGQADAIALGNQRVESGDMQFVALVLDYACLGRDPELAQEVAARSYPSNGQAPRQPSQRAVIAGSDPAWSEARRLEAVKSTQAGFRLYELGEALHVLQDSYTHHGTSDTPQMAPHFTCDAEMAWAHPRARGGWNSHGADLTSRWPAETLELARATYEALVRYPAIGTVQRKPAEWEKVRPLLDGFVKASTKAEKQAWFQSHGITDTSFLAGISLADGLQPFTLEWDGRRLPKLPALQSRQHGTDPALLEFFSRFFVDWWSSDDFEALAQAQWASATKRPGHESASSDKVELAARLRLWRIRDHAAVADFAHSQERLSVRQLKALARLARPSDALARYAQPKDALFPLVTNGMPASPLLPFIVRKAPPSSTGDPRAVAIAKLRHAPYDSIGIVAENAAGAWRVIAIVGAVDH